ncbi:hypothetical protein [Roseobacter sp.]|uniref:hypothetical protein n=1 Tax=Roseobacter sp. TaxID=1907202 RepID=UPI00385991FC
MMRLKQRKLVRLRANGCAAAGVYGPLTFAQLDTGIWPVLLNEHAVSLGAAGMVHLFGHVSAGAAAPDAGGFAAIRTTDGKDGETVGGEVRHGFRLPFL